MSCRYVRNMGRAGRILWLAGILFTAGGVVLSVLSSVSEYRMISEAVGLLCAGIPAIAVGLWQNREYRREQQSPCFKDRSTDRSQR